MRQGQDVVEHAATYALNRQQRMKRRFPLVFVTVIVSTAMSQAGHARSGNTHYGGHSGWHYACCSDHSLAAGFGDDEEENGLYRR